jgi:nitrate/TMAO reductase-like tetraheme cytochrome c subunit
MKTVYIASQYGGIRKKEILRETEQSIFVKGWNGKEQRESKVSTSTKVFDNPQDAIDYIIAFEKSEVEKAERRLNEAKQNLSQSQAKSFEDWIKP